MLSILLVKDKIFTKKGTKGNKREKKEPKKITKIEKSVI